MVRLIILKTNIKLQPDYVTSIENEKYVIKNIPKYNLTKGINEKNIDQLASK